MSRETDSSPSGPQGRGASAYPSGTPPYGSPSGLQQDAGEESGAETARKGEPRTETTLTTRIRINIPGSRPIPPVVVRTPVAEGSEATDGRGIAALAQDDGAQERTRSTPVPGAAAAAPDRPDAAEEPAPGPEKKKTSDWFAPRKPMPNDGTPGTDAPAAGAAGTGAQGASGVGTPDAAGVPGAAGLPGAAGESGQGQNPGAATTGYPDTGYQQPFQADAFLDTQGAGSGTGTTPYGGPPVPGSGEQPSGPTAGPATGGSAIGATAGPLGQAGPGGAAQDPGQTPVSGSPAAAPGSADAPHDGTTATTGTTGTPVHGTPVHGTPAHGTDGPPRMSDDTAILTPQKFVPEPGTSGAGQDNSHVSGSTLSSGVPAGSAENRTAPFPGSGRADGPGGRPRPDLTPRLDARPGQGPGGPDTRPGERPEPAAPAPPAAPRPAAKKKGRSKPVLAVVALLVVAGGLYGAGLVMNHADVPKGTTVLGVPIGGSTKEQAVDTLEKQLGKRSTLPLKLTAGGKSKELSPENAGLTLDDQATVAAASGPDYNPVDVIGSLFGRQRPVDPVMPLDDEKLTAALGGMAKSLGSAREGTITFDTGEPVKVPGRSGAGLDVARAKQSVRDAYRNQVQTGHAVTVQLPTVERRPTINQAEIDRAMKEFAKPAMSDIVTIKATDGTSVPFGSVSLPRILSMKAVDGKLVDAYDLNALKTAYGSAFDGVMVKRADGSSTAVTPQDVADQLRVALRGTTPEERTRVIGSRTDGLTG